MVNEEKLEGYLLGIVQRYNYDKQYLVGLRAVDDLVVAGYGPGKC